MISHVALGFMSNFSHTEITAFGEDQIVTETINNLSFILDLNYDGRHMHIHQRYFFSSCNLSSKIYYNYDDFI
jgi:hypothetical protein